MGSGRGRWWIPLAASAPTAELGSAQHLTNFLRQISSPEEMPVATVEELLSKYGRRMDGTKGELWGGWSALSLGLSKWFKDMTAYQAFLIQMCVWFSGLKGRGTWLISKDRLALSPKPSICLENWMEMSSRREKALVFILPHVHWVIVSIF